MRVLFNIRSPFPWAGATEHTDLCRTSGHRLMKLSACRVGATRRIRHYSRLWEEYHELKAKNKKCTGPSAQLFLLELIIEDDWYDEF